MCLMLTRYKSFSDYIYTLITFYLVSFMLAGAVVMLSSFKIVDLTKYNGELQLIPFCLFSSSLIILVLFKFCRKELYKRKRLQSLIYPIKVQAHNNEFIETFAFYDSGNQLYNPRNNKPIVIISQRLFDKLPKNNESFILVKTIAGYKNLITINITFRLYFNTKLNKIYKVQAGVSNDMNIDYDMILHTEMIGD